MRPDRTREWRAANDKHRSRKDVHVFADALRAALGLEGLYTGADKRRHRGKKHAAASS